MPRLVEVNKSQPLEIVPQGRSIWLCQCGLTQNGPYCDGSHMRTIQEDPSKTYVYHNVTQKVIAESPSLDELLTPKPSDTEVIYKNGSTTIMKITGTHSQMSQVLEIRRDRDARAELDEFDAEAIHYIYYEADQPQACMRVQLAANGQVDCESYYPEEYFTSPYRAKVASATRLVKKRGSLANRAHVLNFIHEVWRDQMANDVHIHVINAHEKMQRYYHWLGYKTLSAYDFRHPRLGTPSVVLVADLRSSAFDSWRGNIS